MKREELIRILGEESEKATVDALLNAMHGEIDGHKRAAEAAQAEWQRALGEKDKELEEARKVLAEKQKSFEEAAKLRKKLEALQNRYDDDIAASARALAEERFDRQVAEAIREVRGRNAKAVRALLDMEALRASPDPQADIAAAVKALSESPDGAFLFGPVDPAPTGAKADVGGKTGGKPGPGDGPVRAALGLAGAGEHQ